ncbi:hypothetical protein MRX96_052865 [Rhipicephalus microplus]
MRTPLLGHATRRIVNGARTGRTPCLTASFKTPAFIRPGVLMMVRTTERPACSVLVAKRIRRRTEDDDRPCEAVRKAEDARIGSSRQPSGDKPCIKGG